jgi:hypothetical protein
MLSRKNEDLLDTTHVSSEYMKEIHEFINSTPQFSQEEKLVFISVLTTATYHKVL